MSERQGDREALRDALRLVRQRVPAAVTVHFETSDQDYVGFMVTDVEINSSGGLVHLNSAELVALVEEVWPFMSAIGWDGVMGEDQYGRAAVSLVSDELA